MWLRPVERTVRVREVGGSNPLTPTETTPDFWESFFSIRLEFPLAGDFANLGTPTKKDSLFGSLFLFAYTGFRSIGSYVLDTLPMLDGSLWYPI